MASDITAAMGGRLNQVKLAVFVTGSLAIGLAGPAAAHAGAQNRESPTVGGDTDLTADVHAATQRALGAAAANPLGEAVPEAVKAAPAAPDVPAVPAARPAHAARPAPAVQRGVAPSYRVRPGDTLAGIARKELGSAADYQEIFALNEGRVQPDGGRLTDPDEIRPGWELRLPRPGQKVPTAVVVERSGPAAVATEHSTEAGHAAHAVRSAVAAYQPATRPSGTSAQAVARAIVPAAEFGCFSEIISHESGWNVHAVNPSSGAYGLPQALPGSKMASAGADWRDDATTQVRWALDYMDSRYGSPCDAWSFWQDHNWY
jgi:hypothetical protein